MSDNFTAEELLLLRKGNRLSIIPVKENIAKRLYNLLGSVK